jgi:hypothetical protein
VWRRVSEKGCPYWRRSFQTDIFPQKLSCFRAKNGFGSLSRFNAAFRRHCGCAPRRYRAMHRL